jgi:hypothetical protein
MSRNPHLLFVCKGGLILVCCAACLTISLFRYASHYMKDTLQGFLEIPYEALIESM